MAKFWPYNLCLSVVLVVIFPTLKAENIVMRFEKRNAVTPVTENFKSRINKTTALSDKNHRLSLSLGSSR